MEGFTQFLDMGGYAAYVWSAYGITVVVLALNVVRARQTEKAALAQLAQLARHNRGPSSQHDTTS